MEPNCGECPESVRHADGEISCGRRVCVMVEDEESETEGFATGSLEGWVQG
jgi:hypothetical protein